MAFQQSVKFLSNFILLSEMTTYTFEKDQLDLAGNCEELSLEELENVSGGILPLIGAAVACIVVYEGGKWVGSKIGDWLFS